MAIDINSIINRDIYSFDIKIFCKIANNFIIINRISLFEFILPVDVAFWNG
jgi:hypothetical protein